MAEGKAKSYLRSAFLNIYNLSMFGGAMVAAAATGEYVLAAAAVGLEAVWLLFGPDLKPFRRAVDQANREEREKEDRARVQKLMESLPERDWQRAKALDELRREIERDMQHNPSFQAILLQSELDKLSQLHQSFVHLANACARAETYLSALDPRELERQLKAQEAITQKMTDPQVKDLAQKNIDVIRKRQSTIGEIENFLARARGQMNLIENSVRLLRDQALTMTSPNQLGEQLDDLLTGVEALQASTKETEAIFSGMQMQPISPVSSEQAAAGAQGTRVRG
ncbi:MAG: hypothetical protein JNK82_08700 [Myxococcaceae bacterium]|nr:hypothetical protein [Myxococcaceae bacterium]